MSNKNSEALLQKTLELYEFDRQISDEKGVLCGVDEAGRGPLCGPCCVAAVVLDPNNMILGLNDSKKLSEKKRSELFLQIKEKAVAYNIVLVDEKTIDEINILKASLLGMKMAAEGLSIKPDIVLADGNKCPDVSCEVQAVVKGDAHSASIAAASILAKVTRDEYMLELARQYPEYALEKHKGYPTKLHYELLQIHGVKPFYRKSFLKKRGIV